MMGRQQNDQAQFFYSFHLEERVPTGHLLRRIDLFVTQALAGIHREIAAFYSHTGRPSIDPELMMRMLIVGYCYGIRSERKLCEEVALNLAYRWFCRLDLDDEVRTIPPSRRTGMAASATATCCARSSNAWSACAWPRGWSRVRASRSMRASSKPMPAAITATSRRRSTGRRRAADPRRARVP